MVWETESGEDVTGKSILLKFSILDQDIIVPGKNVSILFSRGGNEVTKSHLYQQGPTV